jgi:hypothetical protein
MRKDITIHREDVLRAVTLITTTLGAILNFYVSKKGLAVHLQESARMKGIFERAQEKLKGPAIYDPENSDDPAKDLGREVLLENRPLGTVFPIRPVLSLIPPATRNTGPLNYFDHVLG